MSGQNISAGGKERREPLVERELLDAIKSTRPVLYVNVANRPMVEIPFEAAPEAREAWPLDSDRVQAEVALFAYSRRPPVVLRDRQITQIVRVLKGLAWRSRRAPRNFTDAFDNSPLLEALDAIVNGDSGEPFEGTMSELVKKLSDAAQRLGINRDEKAWPKGAPQLSKRLSDHSSHGDLAQFGIIFVRDENARPRRVVLRPAQTADATSFAATDQRRDRNAAAQHDLTKVDGEDGAAAIFDFLKAPSAQRGDESLP